MGLPRPRLRTRGEPRSANGASSFHVRWVLPPTDRLVEAAAVLQVVQPPDVRRLYFWALQVSFHDGNRQLGGAHLGLQWNQRHPGGTAVNWGGYATGGRLLVGSQSPLPSAPADPNTRDYPWEPGRRYELRVGPTPGLPGWWRGTVTDLDARELTVVRDLQCDGDRLTDPVVWSEVFARCDHRSVVVRWSGFRAVRASGPAVHPGAVSITYQDRLAGGCDNTAVVLDGDGVLQITNAARAVGHNAVLPLAAPP